MPKSSCCQEDDDACGPFLDQEREIERLTATLKYIADLPPGSQGAYQKFAKAKELARRALSATSGDSRND